MKRQYRQSYVQLVQQEVIHFTMRERQNSPYARIATGKKVNTGTLKDELSAEMLKTVLSLVRVELMNYML